MGLNVISQPAGAIMELSAIVKIHKYRELHERHHFFTLDMEVHDTLGCDMDHFITEYAHLFHNR
jgi:hypothetical protein